MCLLYVCLFAYMCFGKFKQQQKFVCRLRCARLQISPPAAMVWQADAWALEGDSVATGVWSGVLFGMGSTQRPRRAFANNSDVCRQTAQACLSPNTIAFVPPRVQ